MDRHYFHQLFTSIQIKENESVTNYLWCLTYGKAQAESANNEYTRAELVDFALAGLHNTKHMKYDTALQLFHLEHDNGQTFMLRRKEQKFFGIDEKTSCEASLGHLAMNSAASSYQNNNPHHKKGNPWNNKKWFTFLCQME